MVKYAAAVQRFHYFCQEHALTGEDGTTPLPTWPLMSAFAMWLSNTNVRFQTVQGKISGIRTWHRTHGDASGLPLEGPLHDHHKLVMAGILRLGRGTSRERLPLTAVDMMALSRTMGEDDTDLWCACLVAYHGLLRGCELLGNATEPPMTWGDVTATDSAGGTFVHLRLHHSKCDLERMGVSVHIHSTNNDLCPVAALKAVLRRRLPSPGDPVIMNGDKPMSTAAFLDQMRAKLRQAGYNDSKYGTHSFRAGGTTQLAQMGIADALIQRAGRWRSQIWRFAYVHIIDSTAQRLATALSTVA